MHNFANQIDWQIQIYSFLLTKGLLWRIMLHWKMTPSRTTGKHQK